jgi:hypothetical protein
VKEQSHTISRDDGLAEATMRSHILAARYTALRLGETAADPIDPRTDLARATATRTRLRHRPTVCRSCMTEHPTYELRVL